MLERGEIAQRWRAERWDSLRLLTPNWMSRLPGWRYRGTDPDGFMSKQELISCLHDYAQCSAVPVVTNAAVHAVQAAPWGYRVESSQGVWSARSVVIATGYCDRPFVPPMAHHVPHEILQVTPTCYRNSAALPDGGVLVVGASASGVQLADEIRQSGRPVTIAVGRHARMPRCYRGHDIMWWMDRAGIFDDLLTDMPDPQRATMQPSLQLVGRPDHASLDLGSLRDNGVQVVGRAVGVRDGSVHLADDLPDSLAAAQAKLQRVLRRIDTVADAMNAPAEAWPDALTGFGSPPAAIDLAAQGIRTIVWATGFRRNYQWLKVPVLDAAGEIVQRGGRTPSPGLYVLGLPFMRRRKSSFLDGVGTDAQELAADLHQYLSGMVCCAA